jgi:hypothetical protein
MSSECIVTEYTEEVENISTFTSEENFKTPGPKTELEKLIFVLKKGIKDKEPGIKYIKYPELLVVALEDLNGMIGMHRIKEAAAIQTVRLIENLKNGEKSMQMLNTVLMGARGVGKTTVGIKLAKIWFALGFLTGGQGDSSSTTHTKTTKTTNFEMPKSYDMSTLALLLTAWIGTYVIQFMSYMYDKVGLFWLGCFLGIIILVAIIVYYSDQQGKWITKYITKEVEITKNEKDILNLSDRDIITVVSREDFIGGFMGQTAAKTKKLLEDNIGKVLFIDEAYSLLTDMRDIYGLESINTINLFLSEHPDKIVVIFAGYKDHMKSSIFAAQPGLERRCMWKFECDLYSGDELSDIFFLKVNKEKWIINETDQKKIRRLICQNESSFVNNAGDVERLLYLATLEVSRTNLDNLSETLLSVEVEKKSVKQKILTYEDVEKGLIMLKENAL